MMALNTNPEIAFNLILGSSIIVILTIAYLKVKPVHVITLKLIIFGWICGALIFIFDGISILFLDTFTGILANSFQYYTIIFWLLALNYTSKEDYYSPSFLAIIAFGVLLYFAAFSPGAIITQVEAGFLATTSAGIFDILVDVSYIIWALIALAFAVRALRYSPFEIKKEARIFMIGTLIATVGTFSIYFFMYLNPLMIYPADFCSLVGSTILAYCIVKVPKLFYILPFTVYRLTIKDKAGNVLYNYDWSKMKIKNALLTKYLDTIQAVSDKLIKVGGIVDINFSGGIIIIKEGEFTTAALFASRGSRILRQALTKFSLDFEQSFEKELKEKSVEPEKYDSAFNLIEKHFSNFPSRIMTGKDQRIFVSRAFKNLSQETRSRLKEIFPDNAEYEMVLSEMDKTPKCVPDDFLKLYDEMKGEIEADEQANTEKKEKSDSDTNPEQDQE